MIKKIGKLPKIYIACILIIMYLPILITVVYSFNDSKLVTNWQGGSLRWYRELFRDRDLKEALYNSLLLGVSSSLLAGIIGTISAFSIARTHFILHKPLESISLMPIMIPEIVLSIVLSSFFYLINIPHGMITLIIAHTTFCIPYVYLLVKARMQGLDKGIEEAARDLGATPMRTFVDIVIPSILPAVINGMLLAFAMSFDDVILSLAVSGNSVNTLPMKIYTKVKTGITPEMNALAAILLGFTLLFVLLLYYNPFMKKNKNKGES